MKSENDTTPSPKRNPTRRSMLGALAAGSALATAPALSIAAQPDVDAHLFDLIRQLDEVRATITVASAEYDALHKLLPSRIWTTEELTAHHIDGQKEPHIVSLEEIEKNDRWDHPGQSRWTTPEVTDVMTDAGTTRTTTMVSFFPKATETDLVAWRERCAARRALYDAKLSAHEEAERVHGTDAAQERVNSLWADWDKLRERIASTKPATAAGVLAKIRLYVAEAEPFDLDDDQVDLGSTEALLASAMADLKRLVGDAA